MCNYETTRRVQTKKTKFFTLIGDRAMKKVDLKTMIQEDQTLLWT